jgi:hypothetical protein
MRIVAMKKLLLAFVSLLALAAPARAGCSTTLAAGSITIVACNDENVVQNAASFLVSDVAALPLGHWFSWSNAGTKLASGVPVSGQIVFTNGNSSLSWPNHGLTAGSYLTLTTTYPNSSATGALPANFTASTLSVQTVYYVIAAGLTTNNFELSATPGGSAITPSGSSSGAVYGFNLVAGFSAEADVVANGWVNSQQQAATPAPSPPAPLPITGNQ